MGTLKNSSVFCYLHQNPLTAEIVQLARILDYFLVR